MTINKIQTTNKGFIEDTNVLMGSKKLKGFDYNEGGDILKENPCFDFDVYIKIPAIDFYRVIEYFNKLEIEKIGFIADKNKAEINFYAPLECKEIEIKIKSLYPIEENKRSCYDVQYLKTIMKNYKVAELKDEFIEFEFADDYPLKIKLKNHWFLLAPRVEDFEK